MREIFAQPWFIIHEPLFQKFCLLSWLGEGKRLDSRGKQETIVAQTVANTRPYSVRGDSAECGRDSLRTARWSNLGRVVQCLPYALHVLREGWNRMHRYARRWQSAIVSCNGARTSEREKKETDQRCTRRRIISVYQTFPGVPQGAISTGYSPGICSRSSDVLHDLAIDGEHETEVSEESSSCPKSILNEQARLAFHGLLTFNSRTDGQAIVESPWNQFAFQSHRRFTLFFRLVAYLLHSDGRLWTNGHWVCFRSNNATYSPPFFQRDSARRHAHCSRELLHQSGGSVELKKRNIQDLKRLLLSIFLYVRALSLKLNSVYSVWDVEVGSWYLDLVDTPSGERYYFSAAKCVLAPTTARSFSFDNHLTIPSSSLNLPQSVWYDTFAQFSWRRQSRDSNTYQFRPPARVHLSRSIHFREGEFIWTPNVFDPSAHLWLKLAAIAATRTRLLQWSTPIRAVHRARVSSECPCTIQWWTKE